MSTRLQKLLNMPNTVWNRFFLLNLTAHNLGVSAKCLTIALNVEADSQVYGVKHLHDNWQTP